jgi:tetratricopeptide (TPR) repeat protein
MKSSGMDGTPQPPTDLPTQAQTALTARDFPRAALLAARLRWQSPERQAGYQIGAQAAFQQNDFPAAEAILAEAAIRFPNEAWPLVAQTQLAKQRGDRPAQIRLIGALVTRFPHHQAGYQFGAALAGELKRYREAEDFLVPARSLFPGEAWPVAETALLAIAAGNPAQARGLAANLRRRFPNHPAGYEVGSIAARAMQNLAEAAAHNEAAMARFPNDIWPWKEAAWNARARGDLAAAIRHTETLRQKFPEKPDGYQLGCKFLRLAGRFDEAEALARQAATLFPDQTWPEAERAAALHTRANRAASARLAAALATTPDPPPAAKPAAGRIFVILGMHRAGTSLCAKLIQQLGVSLGDSLTAPGFDNPDGFYELPAIVDAHHTLLKSAGADWDTLRLGTKPAQSPDTTAIRNHLRDTVQAQAQKSGGLFAFKDPRTTGFLPLWRDIFAELDIRPIWLLAVRDPASVAGSLASRDHMPRAHAELLWAEHYLTALAELGPHIAAIIHYEDWFAAPLPQLQRLATLIGGDAAGKIAPACAGIKTSLRHNTGAAEATPLARTIHTWLRDPNPNLTTLQQTARARINHLEALAAQTR